jgi:hypothetical protein
MGLNFFSEFSFLFTNDMDENKLPFDNFFKLVTQEQFFQKKPCS